MALERADGAGPFAFLSRRTLLKMSLAGGGLLLGGGGGLWALRGAAPAVANLGVLSSHRYRTLAALARTHLPSGGAFAAGADDYDLARAFDTFLKDEPSENVRDLGTALTLVEYGPLLFDRRFATLKMMASPSV